MNTIQNYRMTNYQPIFYSNRSTPKVVKNKLSQYTTNYFRREGGNEILNEEQTKKVKAILDKHFLKLKKTEVKSPEGDVLFIANPTQKEINELVRKQEMDIEAAVEMIAPKRSISMDDLAILSKLVKQS